jgi:hypothetical protein
MSTEENKALFLRLLDELNRATWELLIRLLRLTL